MEQRKELCEKFIAGRMTVELLDKLRTTLKGGRERKQRPLEIKCCGVTAKVMGPPLESLKAFLVKLGDAIKKLERDGNGPDYLPALLK